MVFSVSHLHLYIMAPSKREVCRLTVGDQTKQAASSWNQTLSVGVACDCPHETDGLSVHTLHPESHLFYQCPERSFTGTSLPFFHLCCLHIE